MRARVAVDASQVDVDALGDELCTIKRTPSLRAIKERLQAGDDVQGARLVTGQHVTIRLGKTKQKAEDE